MTGFQQMLEEIGITKDQLAAITISGDVVEFESDMYYKSESRIHGIGVFAKESINNRTIIGMGTIDGLVKTTLGRFTNHSSNKNAMFFTIASGDLLMVALEDIAKDEEILVDYRDHVLNPCMYE